MILKKPIASVPKADAKAYITTSVIFWSVQLFNQWASTSQEFSNSIIEKMLGKFKY